MKIDIYHYTKTSGSISAGYWGKYNFPVLPRVGDYVYYNSWAEVDKYVVTEVIFGLKKFGRTEIIVHVEDIKE